MVISGVDMTRELTEAAVDELLQGFACIFDAFIGRFRWRLESEIVNVLHVTRVNKPGGTVYI